MIKYFVNVSLASHVPHKLIFWLAIECEHQQIKFE